MTLQIETPTNETAQAPRYVTVERLLVIQTPDEMTSPDDFDCYTKKQKAAFERGEWSYSGLWVVARLQMRFPTPRGDGWQNIGKIESGGLWGIESNNNPDYFKEVASEQCSELRETLGVLGVKPTDIEWSLLCTDALRRMAV